jgi:hypothetical protein
MDYDKLENQLEIETETKLSKNNYKFSLFVLSPIKLKICISLLFIICIIQSISLIVIIKQNNYNNNQYCNNLNSSNTSHVSLLESLSSAHNNGSSINLLNITNNTNNINNINNTNNTIISDDNSILCGTRILTFTSGNYTLKPCDYKFAKFITVEMWGGGGAGSSYNGHGGASGGYIKAIFPTNLQTFQLSVGKGGIGNSYEADMFIQSGCPYINNFPYSNYQYGIPNNGSDSIFISNNKKINMNARGGKWINTGYGSRYTNCYLPQIRPLILNNTLLIPSSSVVQYNINGNNETSIIGTQFTQCQPGMIRPPPPYDTMFTYSGYNGGNAPFGGAGGHGSVAVSWTSKIYSSQNGFVPGGGGGGSGANYDSGIIEYSCVYSGGAGKANGGDGLINIYF